MFGKVTNKYTLFIIKHCIRNNIYERSWIFIHHSEESGTIFDLSLFWWKIIISKRILHSKVLNFLVKQTQSNHFINSVDQMCVSFSSFSSVYIGLARWMLCPRHFLLNFDCLYSVFRLIAHHTIWLLHWYP